MRQPTIEIQHLETPRDFWSRDAATLCVNATHYELYWDDNTQIYAALMQRGIGRVLVGMSSLYFSAEERDVCITRLAVPKEHQGGGIGSRLVNHAVSVANGQDYDTVSVQPTTNRNGDFYRSHGFKYDVARRERHPYRLFLDLSTTVID